MTMTIGTVTPAACLREIERVAGAPLDWRMPQGADDRLLTLVTGSAPALAAYDRHVRSFAEPTADAINKRLAEAGFDIRLDHWEEGQGRFGVAAFMDAAVEWYKPGTLAQITGDDRTTYPAFTLGDSNGLQVGTSRIFRGPVVRIRTPDGLEVRITITPRPRDPFQLVRLGSSLLTAELGYTDFAKATIPCVMLDEQPDISGLVGAAGYHPAKAQYLIAQAVQQLKFGMNASGARVKEATAMGVTRSASFSPVYVVDRPFLIAIGNPKVGQPLFSAYVTEESWREPGNLAAL